MNDVELRLIQQILAHDSGVLSVEELSYRNTDLAESQIETHLRSLHDNRLVTSLSSDPTREGMPDIFWAVTEQGVRKLTQSGLWEEIEVLSESDTALNRSQRIRDIETFDGRPEHTYEISPSGSSK
jgi:DNA-binding PadR family transcriptional regulator